MTGVIAALCRSASPLIVLLPRLPFMLWAVRFPIAERPASGELHGRLDRLGIGNSCSRQFENRL